MTEAYLCNESSDIIMLYPSTECLGQKSAQGVTKMMIRSFLPIGQGAFYLECFKRHDAQPINVVYDCGSLNGEKIVKAEICGNFQKEEDISGVFISHLDRDHINGLPYLLQYCNVKNIFLPLITEKNRKWLLLKDLVESSSLNPSETDFVRKFLQDPYTAILEITHTPPVIYYIYETDQMQTDLFPLSNHVQYLRSGQNVADYIFSSVHYNTNDDFEWKYIPYNFNEKKNLEYLIKALYTQLGKNYSCEELSVMIKKDQRIRTEVKAAYKKVPGSFNINSMTLLSMTEDRVKYQYPDYRCCFPFCNCFTVPNGCLYTGDYDTNHQSNWEQLMSAYEDYMEYIGCIQVPHHGSRYSYNHGLSELVRCQYYVISAGEKNSFRHPHGSVIRDILMAHKLPMIVTEQRSNMVHFIVEN